MEYSGKKALIISETYLPLIGGAEMYTYNFAKQLVNRGMHVTIATHTTGDIPPDYHLQNTTVVHIAKPTKSEPFRMPRFFAEVFGLVHRHDVLFANYTYVLAAIAGIASSVYGKRLVVFAHGLGTIINEGHPRTYRVYRAIALRLAFGVVTTSEEIAAIVRRYASRVLVATAVDFSHIDTCLQDSGTVRMPVPTIVTVRRLVEKNGIQYLIEAIPYLREFTDNFSYHVIGDGRLRPVLEQRVRDLGLSEYVIFEGALPNDQVFSRIRDADVVAFPSSAEALSLAAIECMYIKTPIVVSAIGGLKELVGAEDERGASIDLFGREESSYLAPEPSTIPEQTYKRFAEILYRSMQGGEDTRKKCDAAYEYVRGAFDWPHVAENILSFRNQ